MRLTTALLGLLIGGCVPAATRPVRVLPSTALAFVPPASRYREGLPPPPREPRVRFEALLSPSTRALLRYEPALEGVARAIGETFSRTGQPPATSLIHWLFWRAGVLGRLGGTRLLVSKGAAGGARFERELARWAQRASTEVREPQAFALARFDTLGGDDVQVLVFAEDLVELELPRALNESSRLTVAGRLKVPASGLVLFLDDDEGQVRRFPVPVGDAGRFSVSVVGPSRAGRRFLELVATDATGGWSRSVALAPLSIEAAEPAEIDLPPPAKPEQGWRSRLRAAWAAKRVALGLPPLEASAALDHRAEALANSLAATPGKPPLAEEALFSAQTFDDFDDYLWFQARRPSIREMLFAACPLQHGVAVAPTPDGMLLFVEILECPRVR